MSDASGTHGKPRDFGQDGMPRFNDADRGPQIQTRLRPRPEPPLRVVENGDTRPGHPQTFPRFTPPKHSIDSDRP
jgi:hypothetical protein